jgi:hypothetical protein
LTFGTELAFSCAPSMIGERHSNAMERNSLRPVLAGSGTEAIRPSVRCIIAHRCHPGMNGWWQP